jgi:ABC-type sulfate transport system permease component
MLWRTAKYAVWSFPLHMLAAALHLVRVLVCIGLVLSMFGVLFWLVAWLVLRNPNVWQWVWLSLGGAFVAYVANVVLLVAETRLR